MFDTLSSRLEKTFRNLRNRGALTEADIDSSLLEIRSALLEADVNLDVVKSFCASVKEKALGMKVLKSLNPGQMVIKFVHDSLIESMGEQVDLSLRHTPPVIIMLVGLQGSGKTTSAAKLALHLKDDHRKRAVMASIDVYRPAAIQQLEVLAKQVGVDFFASQPDQKPTEIAKAAIEYAKKAAFDVLVLDTAGRLQIDQAMMDELADVTELVQPHEILLVADAMTGQEAVNVAKGFNDRLEIDGIILTKLDGDARGGAALSMRAVTQKPIKFIGIGEKTDALEIFHPDRMASRILGMGDVLTLIEKAAKQVDAEEAKKLQKKMKRNEFTLEDFHSQLQTIKRMGSISSLAKMIPGAGKVMKDIEDGQAESEMKRIEAIILSMTPSERNDHTVINGSRRKRIALGSGTSVEEVNRLLEQFSMMRKAMSSLAKMGPNAMRALGSMMGSARPQFGR